MTLICICVCTRLDLSKTGCSDRTPLVHWLLRGERVLSGLRDTVGGIGVGTVKDIGRVVVGFPFGCCYGSFYQFRPLVDEVSCYV